MEGCLFCRMAKGEIPVKKVYETEEVLCFHDIAPQAPVHVLVVPKRHLSGLNDQPADAAALMAALLAAAKEVAQTTGIADRGWRLISNCGPDARQSVQHLHFHVLGGKTLSEEMD